MIVKCCGCGVEKDMDRLEVYTHLEDECLTDQPIPPILVLDTDHHSPFRHAPVCFECFHRLEPDMWIDRRSWDSIHPVVAWDNLPEGSHRECKY